MRQPEYSTAQRKNQRGGYLVNRCKLSLASRHIVFREHYGTTRYLLGYFPENREPRFQGLYGCNSNGQSVAAWMENKSGGWGIRTSWPNLNLYKVREHWIRQQHRQRTSSHEGNAIHHSSKVHQAEILIHH